MKPQHQTDAQAIIETTAASLLQQTAGIDGIPFVILPEGFSAKSLEVLMSVPSRTRATVTVNAATSFIDYFNAHATKDSVIFAQVDQNKITGVIDYPEPGKTSWASHRLVYECVTSREYEIWKGKNGVPMTQAAFSEFIDANLVDFVEPDGAVMLEVATSLEMKKTVDFQSGHRLQDGTIQFVFNEDSKATAGKGKLQIPAEFAIALPIFRNGTAYRLQAKLRYRIKDGVLSFWFDIPRLGNFVEKVFLEECKTIEDKVLEKVGVPILHGTPPTMVC
ncbi:MAG: DUF2303 family protein [Magnetococcales bacterium]|nr:DUF2303 family protein [Magnetococcales bacterium]